MASTSLYSRHTEERPYEQGFSVLLFIVSVWVTSAEGGWWMNEWVWGSDECRLLHTTAQHTSIIFFFLLWCWSHFSNIDLEFFFFSNLVFLYGICSIESVTTDSHFNVFPFNWKQLPIGLSQKKGYWLITGVELTTFFSRGELCSVHAQIEKCEVFTLQVGNIQFHNSLNCNFLIFCQLVCNCVFKAFQVEMWIYFVHHVLFTYDINEWRGISQSMHFSLIKLSVSCKFVTFLYVN